LIHLLTIDSELDTAVNTFRDVLRQSWTRRAIRMLTISRTPSSLSSLTLEQILTFRDKEWEARERAYHNTALDEVNSLVRKYNGMAPYAVRRGHYALNAELDRAYRESAQDILTGIAERMKAGSTGLPKSGMADWDDESEPSQVQVDASWSPVRIRDVVREWFGKLARR
jgi:DnaJ homolog subfamily C member 28